MYVSLCAIRSWNWKFTQDHFLIDFWIQRTTAALLCVVGLEEYSAQGMTGEPRPRYNALQLLGVSGACAPLNPTQARVSHNQTMKYPPRIIPHSSSYSMSKHNTHEYIPHCISPSHTILLSSPYSTWCHTRSCNPKRILLKPIIHKVHNTSLYHTQHCTKTHTPHDITLNP